MPNYNFLNLSPPEFEDLCRDLLQKKDKIYLESFTSGRDSGIDLRYSQNSKINDQAIYQCKRYSKFNELFSNLKKEVEKVRNLNPSKYILCTSVGLTPMQKDKIIKLLNPYIKDTADIFGMDDINNLLGQFSEIEKKHFKLWLSSTNILERILNSKIYLQTSFEEDKIKKTIQLYVENESFYKALKIIKENKYIIISGIPGIGKTTLARILVYHFLANGFEEFIFLSDSIDEGYKVFNDNKKQIFFFDDFLGRNFLEKTFSNNEEQRIVRFIEKVRFSENKLLILTTREYILAQAKLKYDSFDNPTLEFAKCIIDLDEYTKLVKAKILYNHLYFSNLNSEYLENIISQRSYLKIISHKNYNPRIIEAIIKPEVWGNIESKSFSEKFISFLNYPESVWKHVFENQISSLSQCILVNLVSAGTPILLSDLQKIAQNFAHNFSTKYNILYNSINLKKSIRELENTFIITKKDSKNNITVEFQNPSIQDFLLNYLKDDNDFILDTINSSVFFNQLFKIFSLRIIKNNINGEILNPNKIILNKYLKDSLFKKILTDFDDLNSSDLSKRNYYFDEGNFIWYKKEFSDYEKLNIILNNLYHEESVEIQDFLINRFQQIIIPYEVDNDDFTNYLDLLEKFISQLNYDSNTLMSAFFENIVFLQDIYEFERFGNLFTEAYDEFIESERFLERISEIMGDESSNTDDNNLSEVLFDISAIGDKFNIDYYDIKKDLEKRIQRYEDEDEDEEYNWERRRLITKPYSNSKIEDSIIDDLFKSLK